MKKQLFDKYERHSIINCLSGNYPGTMYIMRLYYVAKFRQEVYKKMIVPFCDPIIKYLSKLLNK